MVRGERQQVDVDDELILNKAPYFAEGLIGRVDAFRLTMRKTPALHHAAHYTNGLWGFALDRLGVVSQEEELAGLRERLTLAGRGLAVLHQSLGRELQGALQGTLIRTVYQTDRGAFACELAVPREIIVGVHFAKEWPPDSNIRLTRRPGIEEVDRAMADLTTSIRAQLSLGDQNPGGFAGFIDAETGIPVEQESETLDPDPWASTLRTAVRPTDLHYAARIRCSPADFREVSELDAVGLARFHTQIEPNSRRQFYRQLADRLPAMSQAIGSIIARVLGAPLRRIVLDVEQGAFYVYPLSSGEYLLGSTVDQAQVAMADERMAYVARKAASGAIDAGGCG